MMQTKTNIVKGGGGFSYNVITKPVMVEGSAEPYPCIKFTGRVEKTIMNNAKPLTQSTLDEATEWTVNYLKDSPKASEELFDLAMKGYGFKQMTIRRALKVLRAINTRPKGISTWALPEKDISEARTQVVPESDDRVPKKPMVM
jgi:hypothetical protein